MKITNVFVAITLGTLLVSSRSAAQSEAPVIDTHPESQTVEAGSTVTFSVTASGLEPLTYQWFFNGTEISGATESSLVIPDVTFDDAGSYIAGVGNEGGIEFSDPATLTVTEAPEVPGPQTFLDFNDDGKADLLWVHADGRIAAWLMDGTNFLGSLLLPQRAPSGWRLVGQADFDKDGRIDFLWHHRNGSLRAWLMDGTNHLSSVNFPRRPNAAWRVGGVDDFNKDGSPDILWHHGNGLVAIWLMDGVNIIDNFLLNDGKRRAGGWKVAGLVDVDGDDDNDILWQHGGGRLLVWYLDGAVVQHAEEYQFSGKTSSSWYVTGTSDLNGDGENDLLWRHTNGYIALWLMNGSMEPQAHPLREGRRAAKEWKLKTR